MKRAITLLLLVSAFAATGATANATHTRIAAKWKNCTAVHKRYPNGVGRNNAHDHTSGVPVTNFKHSTRLYKLAMHYNKGLDRDRDGIACSSPSFPSARSGGSSLGQQPRPRLAV